MNIQHHSGDTKGEFYIERNGDTAAKITYTKLGSTQVIVDHMEVSDDVEGQSIGRKLVEQIVNYARKHELKLIPLCPFVKSIIERDESLQDVLKRRR
ncbi:MAG: GNAT family N-acetyltransferase [Balneolaceae bacterium]